MNTPAKNVQAPAEFFGLVSVGATGLPVETANIGCVGGAILIALLLGVSPPSARGQDTADGTSPAAPKSEAAPAAPKSEAAPAVPPAVSTPAVSTPAVEKSALQVSSDKRVYAHGDVMKVTIEVPADGFLRLYGVSADGTTAMLFPNKWAKDDKVSKGRLVLPAEDAPYDFMLTLDEGQTKVTESVHAVFSPQPFTDSGAGTIRFGSSQFEALGVTTAAQRSTRGLKPTARTTAAAVETKYELKR
jgi:hypothetical protein